MKRNLCLALVLLMLLTGCNNAESSVTMTYECSNGERIAVTMTNSPYLRTEGDVWFYSKDDVKVGEGFFEPADSVWSQYYAAVCNWDYAHIIDEGTLNDAPWYMAEVFLGDTKEYTIITYIPGSHLVCTMTAPDAPDVLRTIHSATSFVVEQANEEEAFNPVTPKLYDYLLAEYGGVDTKESLETDDDYTPNIEQDPGLLQAPELEDMTLDLTEATTYLESSALYSTSIMHSEESSDVVNAYRTLAISDKPLTAEDSYWPAYCTEVQAILENTGLFTTLVPVSDSTASRTLQGYGDGNMLQYYLYYAINGFQTAKYSRTVYNSANDNPDWSVYLQEAELLTGIHLTTADIQAMKALALDHMATTGYFAVMVEDEGKRDSISFTVSEFGSENENWCLQVTRAISIP